MKAATPSSATSWSTNDRPYKITIISRGMAGGSTRFLPDEESHYRTPSMLRDQLCTALGGHAAEELISCEASTGPSDDIEQVTGLARAMVTRWGMSERLVPRTFGRSDSLVFLGREISETRNYGERVAEEIDGEVRRLIDEAQERARTVLQEHRALLDNLANVLLEVETLGGDDLTQLLNGDASVTSTATNPLSVSPPPSLTPETTPGAARLLKLPVGLYSPEPGSEGGSSL